MKTPLRRIALALCCLAAPAAAQTPGSPVSDAMRSSAQRAGRNLVAAAEEMPAGKYGFKPTPTQMSFGEVIAHLVEGNDFLCSKIGGVTPPKRAELAGKVPYFGDRDVTRAQAMFATAEEWAGHYSQLAIYLRLNGLLPPTAKRTQE